MYDVTPIKNYILYLKKECELSVSVHIDGIDKIVIPSELISFNIHDISYCIYVKTNAVAQKHCVESQCQIHKRSIDSSFCGICYAGVKEFIYPIKNLGKTVGFISVSGYKCDNYEEYVNKISKKYELSKAELLSLYDSLKDESPNKEKIDTLITPLCDMLELAYIKTQDELENQPSFCDELVQYLKKNHTENISSKNICRQFLCSRSKISHTFNKCMGMSIKQYINKLRIDDAKALLEHSDLAITEIAFSVGFSDSNYFTGIFKKNVGITPSEYRKNKPKKYS